MANTRLEIIIAAQDRASQTLNQLVKTTAGLQSSVNDLGEANTRASTRVQGLTGSVFKAGLALEALKIGANLVGNALQTAFDVGNGALAAAATYEQTAIAFRVMLGDATKARTLLKEISDFAAKTPFELPEVVAASKQLLAFGIAQERIIPTIRMLGDVASGVGVPIGQIGYAFGQVQVAGKLMGQELLQFTNAGVPLIETLAEVMNQPRENIRKLVEEGQVSFPIVEQAFQRMTSEGGRFYNLMEQQSRTYNGTISNLRDNFMRMSLEIIGISQDGTIRQGSIFQTLTASAQNLLKWVDENRAAIERFARTLADQLVGFIQREVIPWLQRFGQELLRYISSPQFQRDFHNFLTTAQATGSAIMTLAHAGSQVVSSLVQIRDTMQAINRITPGGMVAALLQGKGLPGLDDFKNVARRLKIPGFATGTSFAPGGLAVVGERGPELIDLPRGSQVYTNQQSRQMAGATGGVTFHIGQINNYSTTDIQAEMKAWGFMVSTR